MAFPSRRKMQERENWSVADTTFLDSGLNLSLTSVCVGMGLAYCFMLMLLVARAFLRPEGDSCTTGSESRGHCHKRPEDQTENINLRKITFRKRCERRVTVTS